MTAAARAAVRRSRSPSARTANPLLTTDNVGCTPHIGYLARGKCETRSADSCEQISANVAGAPINWVNPLVLSKVRLLS